MNGRDQDRSAGSRSERRGPDRRPGPLGGALRRAWVGYQRRLEEAMTQAGFPDRRFPDGRVLRLCARPEGATASQIGRELGITRQGAAKLVSALRDRGYVSLQPSPSDAREKLVALTPRGHDYLAAQRAAARRIERELQEALGDETFAALSLLLEALGTEEQPRMRDYLRYATRLRDEGDAI